MVSALFDIDSLFESIKDQTLLLTSNRRLAAHIKSAYAEACSRHGLQVWEQPTVFPIDDWIQHCWQQLINADNPLTHHKIRLQPLQETLLWERIIRDDEKSLLLKPFATAKQAQSAWRTLQLWQTDISPDFYFHPDCNRFAYWAKQFQQQGQKQQLLSHADQTKVVLEAFKQSQLASEPNILLVGFQHLPPLYEQLINAATDTCQIYEATTPAKQNLQLACNDALQELQAAARWAKQQLENNSQQRLAIIVPDLAQQRDQIEATLAAVFEPQYLLPDTARYQLPFNISAGVPLSQTSLVISALNLLELLRDEFSYQTLYALLKSPFISTNVANKSHTPFDGGSELELFLRNGGWPTFNLTQLLDSLSANPALCNRHPVFYQALQTARELQNQQTRNKTQLSHWANLFATLLRSFNWPASGRRLDSIEFQQHTRWQQALRDFSALSLANNGEEKVSLNEALNLLNRVVGASDFQAQTPQTPIQVLGMLEGSGLNFDAVWLLGLNDHLWPASASPSPFIPAPLQRDLDMPHASPERELQFARELLKGYLHSAPLVIASYALNNDDQLLRASSLIQAFEPVTLAQLGLDCAAETHPYYSFMENQTALQTLQDNHGPRLNIDAESVAGGSAILKDQAACPFRAFANHRLSARALEEPSYHLNAAQRGTVLHSALEHLWCTLEDSTTLLERTEPQLQNDICEAVQTALRPLVLQRKDLFGAVYSSSETQRITRLLEQWLAVEKTRSAFEVVATEKALIVNIQGLPLRVRIDRIDRLNDGSLMLIDYKTGYCSTSKWQGERLEEPQLPLYSITMAGIEGMAEEIPGDGIQSLAFARINIDQQGFVGISAQHGVAPGIYSIDNSRGWDASLSWSDINSQWQQALASLATEFTEGLAIVEPAQNNTCQFCQLHSLCRIHQIKEQAAEIHDD